MTTGAKKPQTERTKPAWNFNRERKLVGGKVREGKE